jgi:hypothetical protein
VTATSRVTRLEDREHKVLLIIADISGYTRFMTANAKVLAHAQLIITELLETILGGFDYPVEVSKLEGDAVFMYCKMDSDEWAQPQTQARLSQQVLTSYTTFFDRVVELDQSRICVCDACANIDRLRLKTVVHAGTALFHKVGNFTELAGVDVIMVHRLMKNSVDADEYILATDLAFDELNLPEDIPWSQGSENYAELGTVSTRTFVPKREQQAALTRLKQRPLLEKTFSAARHFTKRTLGSQPVIWGLSELPAFKHIPQVAGPTTRIIQALLLAVMTPLILALGYGAIVVRESYQHFASST